jgi:hypothetical protein
MTRSRAFVQDGNVKSARASRRRRRLPVVVVERQRLRRPKQPPSLQPQPTVVLFVVAAAPRLNLSPKRPPLRKRQPLKLSLPQHVNRSPRRHHSQRLSLHRLLEALSSIDLQLRPYHHEPHRQPRRSRRITAPRDRTAAIVSVHSR